MTILVIADHSGNRLSVATRSCITAASKIGGAVNVLVAGLNCTAVAQQAASTTGVDVVLHADDAVYAHPIATALAPLVVDCQQGASHILAATTSQGKDLMPRVAGLLDVAQISEVIAVESDDTFVHSTYAGNILETVQSSDATKVLTIRATAFDAANEEGGGASIESVTASAVPGGTTFIDQQISVSERPELTSADIVVSGGRALGSAENFQIIEQLADKLGAGVGASRAAVDAGYVPNEYQVGQTGKVVAPQLYIAIGLSGAIQHLAGMKDSKVIVAINKDEEAPICQVADYWLKADLFDAVPELMKELDA